MWLGLQIGTAAECPAHTLSPPSFECEYGALLPYFPIYVTLEIVNACRVVASRSDEEGWVDAGERKGTVEEKVDSNSHFNFVVLTAEQSAQCRWISVKQACGLYFDVFR